MIQINRLFETKQNVTYGDVVAWLGDEGAWVLATPLLRRQIIAMLPEGQTRVDA